MQYRVKLEFELDSDLNVAQVRERLRFLTEPIGIHPIVAGMRELVQVPNGGLCRIDVYSASPNTRFFGRKLTDEEMRIIAEAHAPDDIDTVRPSQRFVD